MDMPLQDVVIFVDPGHGGLDPGAVGVEGLREASVVLDIGLKLSDKLMRMGATVIMSRTQDSFVSLQERVIRANSIRAPSDLFISIHCNANNNRSIHGMEVYHHGNSKEGPKLAKYISDEMGARFPSRRNRGAKSDYIIYPGKGFHVLRNTRMPAVLVEVDYISNPEVEIQLRDEGLRTAFAESIAEGLRKYWQGR